LKTCLERRNAVRDKRPNAELGTRQHLINAQLGAPANDRVEEGEATVV